MAISMNMEGTMFSANAQIEYRAWKKLVEILKENEVDINKNDALNEALMRWANARYEYRRERDK